MNNVLLHSYMYKCKVCIGTVELINSLNNIREKPVLHIFSCMYWDVIMNVTDIKNYLLIQTEFIKHVWLWMSLQRIYWSNCEDLIISIECV